MGVSRRRPAHDRRGTTSCSQPHNEHWSTAPYLVYRLLEATFGIRSYWPYIGLAILLHLVVVHLVWRVMLQARITPVGGDGRVLPLLVLGAGSQNLLWAFQIGFLGSVALGLGAMLLVNHAGAWQRRDWAALGLVLFALLWSGVSVLLVVVCVLVVLLRRGIKPAAAFATPPALVYIVWALAYPPPTNLAAPTVRAFSDDLWPFVATGLSTAADAFVLDAPLLGSICAPAPVRVPRAHRRAGHNRGRGGVRLRRRSASLSSSSRRTGGETLGIGQADGVALRVHRDRPAGAGGRDGRSTASCAVSSVAVPRRLRGRLR